MISRALDATFINAVVNHPAVRPHLPGGPGYVDLTAQVANVNNVVLQAEHGAMLFVQVVKGIYELHTQILPDGRGQWALQFARACVEWLFCRTNAVEVYTRVPQGNVAAMALARACGAKPEHPSQVQNIGGEEVTVEIYGGGLRDWLRTAPGLVERGQLFHEKLKEKAKAAGYNISHHADDDWHDRYVGAAAGMILGGQYIKGIMVFNLWASWALAPRVTLISAEPLIIDITDCKIEVHGDDFEVIPCLLQ